MVTPAPRRLAILALVVALVVTACLTAWQADVNRRERATRFAAVADRAAQQLTSRVESYALGLRGARGAIVALGAERLDRERFDRYFRSRHMLEEFPGIRGVGFIRRVPRADEAAFVRFMREDMRTDFAIRQIQPHDGDRYVIQYVEPIAANREALGLDIASEAARFDAAVVSMRRGDAALTAPLTLVQASGTLRRGFLMLVPVYRSVEVPEPEARERDLVGWTYAPLVIDEVLGEPDADYAITLGDLDAGDHRPFYASVGPRAKPADALRVERHLALLGRQWNAEIEATPRFVASLNQREPLVVALAGTLASMFSAIVAALLGHAEKRRAQVHDEQARLSAIVTNSSDAIVAMNLDGTITDWTPGAVQLFGYSRWEAVGKSVGDLIVPEDRQLEEQDILAAVSRGERVTAFDTVRRHRSGRLIDVSSAASPIIGADGTVIGLAKALRDIGPAKRAERAVRELNATLEAQVHERTQALETARRDLSNVLDAVPLMIGYWDRKFRNRFANRACESWFGFDQETLRGMHAHELLGAAYPQALPYMEAALRGEPQVFERTLDRISDGATRVTLTHYVPDVVDGQVEGIYSIVLDITDRQRAEVELAEKNALLQTVLESASEVSIIAATPDLTIKVFNRGAERLLGYRADEIVDRTTPILIHDADEVAERAKALSLQTGRPIEGGQVFIDPSVLRKAFEWTYVRKDGGRVPVSLTVTAMYRADGQLSGYLGVALDVRKQKQIEESLRNAKRKADLANEAKSSFLANMSHEIRTPLNAVIGLTHLLGGTALDRVQADHVRKITLAGKSLLSVINDVLDLSKIEAGELIPEQSTFRARDLIAELCDLMRVDARAKDIDFTVERLETFPERLIGDETRLRQILTNVVANAIKFTERGGVALRLRVGRDEDRHVRVAFIVQDSGIGIPHEIQEKIFAPFAQGDTSTTRRFGGSGLGLSIVGRLVDLMGGRVWVKSTPGHGSVFCVELPFGLPSGVSLDDAGPAPKPASDRLEGRHVLIVDDSDINVEVARRVLERAGASTTIASNGAEAIETLCLDGTSIDAVLMDLQMPLMDGFEATRRIRGELGLPDLPVIALTASATTSERQRALDAGMNGFLSKPFDPVDLVRLVAQYVRPGNVTAATVAPVVDAPIAAEDDPRVEAWPSIEGIDEPAVRLRLDNDATLFMSMMRSLLDDIASIYFPSDQDDIEVWRACGALVHKLKGAAGTLGAIDVQASATDVEVALKGADGTAMEMAIGRLVDAMQSLTLAAEPVVQAFEAAMAAASGAPVEPLDLVQFDALFLMLRSQSLDAAPRFRQLAPQLRAALPADHFTAIERCMTEFAYARAAQLLAECRERVAEAIAMGAR